MDKIIFFIGAMIMPNGNACAQREKAIAEYYKHNGFKCVFIGLHHQKSKNIIETKESYNNIDCFSIKYPKNCMEWLKRMISIKDFLKIFSLYQGEKAILLVDFEVIATKKLLKYAKFHDIKVIFDSEEWYEKSLLAFPKNFIKDWDTNFRMFKIHPQAKNMICASNYLYNYYKDSVSNIVVLPGIINKHDIKWEVLSKNYTDKTKLVYAGNLGIGLSKERIDILISSFNKVKIDSLELIIIGCEKSKLNGMVTNNKSIKVLGRKTQLECINIIKSCDFSIIPREKTRKNDAGFPTKLSESFGCGTPVIATDTSDIKEYIEEGKNGYLLPVCTEEEFIKVFEKISRLTIEQRLEMKKYTKDNNKLIIENYEKPMKEFLEKLYNNNLNRS